jgi:ribosome-associated protein
MDIRKLQRAIVDGLEDVKAQHIAVFNTEHLSALFERVVIASGTSNRQTKALAASVREAVKGRGMDVMSVEGEDNGEWIIVDCGAAVVHIMQPAIREYYHLEEIWGGKTVRLKIGEVNTRLVKASEPEPVGKPGKPVKPMKPARKAKAQVRAEHDSVRPARTRNAARDADQDLAPAAPTRSTAKAARADKPTREVVEKKATNRSAAFQRVAAKAPASKTAARKTASRVSAAPATKTIVVKASGQSAARKSPAAKKAAPKPARKTASRSK